MNSAGYPGRSFVHFEGDVALWLRGLVVAQRVHGEARQSATQFEHVILRAAIIIP